MPLKIKNRRLFRLRMKHKPKREYFTLLIPCVIAVLIFSFGLYSGVSISKTAGGKTSGESEDDRLKRYEELLKLLEEQEAGGGTTTNSTSGIGVGVGSKTEPKSGSWLSQVPIEYLAVGCTLIALTAYAADVTVQRRRMGKHEEDFANFLFELSELIRGGIDPIKSMISLSERDMGSITKKLRVAAQQTRLGFTFEQAMMNLGESLKSDLIKRYSELVVQASYSGGAVSSLIQRASLDMRTFLSIQKEKDSGLKQYIYILYFAQIILIAICVTMVIQFLPSLQQLSVLGSTGGGFFGGSDLANVTVESDMLYLLLISGFLGGLVIGKVSEGQLKLGLKHSLVLLVITLVAWQFTVVAPVSADNYNVTVVSYDKSGVAGLPMKNPLAVKVTGQDGKPASGVLVSFSATGDTRFSPSSLVTDALGTAKTTVILGSSVGVVEITITAGSNSTTITVVARDYF